MVAEPGLVLQEGDRVRVVAPTSKMAEITKFFGDSSRGLTDLNPIALGIGMALGIAIGELPILTPSGEYFSIGSAAGTLIVGLIFGRIGRIGPIATALPFTTCQVMAELGLLVFLAQAGAKAGGQILEALPTPILACRSATRLSTRSPWSARSSSPRSWAACSGNLSAGSIPRQQWGRPFRAGPIRMPARRLLSLS